MGWREGQEDSVDIEVDKKGRVKKGGGVMQFHHI
jgi:hypothetical protein